MKAKTLRHNLERTWRRSRTYLDRSRYKHQFHLYNRMMTKAKSKYQKIRTIHVAYGTP